MLNQFLVVLGLTAVTVIIHGAGALILASVIARRRYASVGADEPLRVVLRTVGLVSFLLFLHLAEASVWAACYVLAGLFPDFETAAYYSLMSYTTVGYEDVLLSNKWRMFGPIEAGVGVLMFGWSTAIMVATLERDFAGRFPAARNAR